jgi:NCS1 family nucleobase:cation symporter-1
VTEGTATGTDRSFGFLDHAALWGSLGLTLAIMPFGSLLVPSLSLGQAFLAVATASLLGALLLAAAAAIGAHTGLSSAELFGSVLGLRGPRLIGALLTVRNVLWGAFALALIADSAGVVSDRALGAAVRPLWVLLFGGAGTALAVAGPEFVVRKVLRRYGIWIALIIAAMLTYNAYSEFGVPANLQRPAVGGWPSFWQAVDVMLIVPLLWLPLVADYSRHGRSVGTAFSGTATGYFVGAAWFGMLGVLYLPAVETADIAGFVQVGIADFVFAGMKVGTLALFILLFLQLDELFANSASTSVSLRSAIPGAGARRGALFAGGAAVILALALDVVSYEASLLLLASLFVPLFGVLVADFLQSRGSAQLAAAPSALAAWALGFLLYHWISPADVGWWQDAMSWLFADALQLTFPLTDEATWLGAAIPSFLAGFLLHTVGRVVVAWLRPQSTTAPAS